MVPVRESDSLNILIHRNLLKNRSYRTPQFRRFKEHDFFAVSSSPPPAAARCIADGAIGFPYSQTIQSQDGTRVAASHDTKRQLANVASCRLPQVRNCGMRPDAGSEQERD